ncbi:unnamed protein product [Protopolystoma xenopodis]|uniref:SGTA homodimerisation domain-containing protein n=1 Tax=Protopolystoma xenopodis TaxID=117903 RepID=A0A3S5CI93_9PLAT|nr:unnamed protein product [Protopolystoma xenopodis]
MVFFRLYQSIADFLRKEARSDSYSAGILESLEIARQCIETAFSLNPEAPSEVDLIQVFGGLNKNRTKLPEASEEAKQMAENLKAQGNQCMKEEQFQEAVACYTKAIEMAPSTAVYYCNRAAAYSRMSRHQDTVKDCERALEIDPDYSKAYGRMGLAYSSMDNHARAVECYQKALELDPTNENCRQNLQIAKNRLQSSSTTNPDILSALANVFGNFNPNSGVADEASILRHPLMQNLAHRFISNPNMQNL